MSQCLDKFCFWFNLLAFCICVNSWKRSFCSRPLTPFFSTSYTPFTTLCLSFHTHTHIYIFRHIHTHTHTHTFRHKHFMLISTSKISTNYDKILIQDQTDQDFQMIQNLWTKSWIAEIIDKDRKIVESFCRNTQKKMCENEIDDVIRIFSLKQIHAWRHLTSKCNRCIFCLLEMQEKEFQFNLEEENKKLLKRREDKLSVFFQNFVSNHFKRSWWEIGVREIECVKEREGMFVWVRERDRVCER